MVKEVASGQIGMMEWKHYLRTVAIGLPCLLLAPQAGDAITFGELNVTSRLGEELVATVAITLRPDEISQGVIVSLGSSADYRVLELDRSLPLSSINVKMVGDGDQRSLQISSQGALQEPFFNLLLKTAVGRGSYFRNFPVFLDISSQSAPVSQPEPSIVEQPVEQPVAVVTAVPVVVETVGKPLFESEAGSYGPVRADETLSSIARDLQGDSQWNMLQIAVAIWRKNLQVFARENMSGLRAGATLFLPTSAEIAAVPVQEAADEYNRQWALWKQGFAVDSAEVVSSPSASDISDKPPSTPNASPKEPIGEVRFRKTFVDMNITLEPESSIPATDYLDKAIDMIGEYQPDQQSGIVLAKDTSLENVADAEARKAAKAKEDQEKLLQMSSNVVELHGKVEQLNQQVSGLLSNLQISENSRAKLQRRLRQLEASITKLKAEKEAVTPSVFGSWKNGVLYAGAALVVALLVGLLLFMDKKRRHKQAPQVQEPATLAAQQQMPEQENPQRTTIEKIAVESVVAGMVAHATVENMDYEEVAVTASPEDEQDMEAAVIIAEDEILPPATTEEIVSDVEEVTGMENSLGSMPEPESSQAPAIDEPEIDEELESFAFGLQADTAEASLGESRINEPEPTEELESFAFSLEDGTDEQVPAAVIAEPEAEEALEMFQLDSESPVSDTSDNLEQEIGTKTDLPSAIPVYSNGPASSLTSDANVDVGEIVELSPVNAPEIFGDQGELTLEINFDLEESDAGMDKK